MYIRILAGTLSLSLFAGELTQEAILVHAETGYTEGGSAFREQGGTLASTSVTATYNNCPMIGSKWMLRAVPGDWTTLSQGKV